VCVCVCVSVRVCVWVGGWVGVLACARVLACLRACVPACLRACVGPARDLRESLVERVIPPTHLDRLPAQSWQSKCRPTLFSCATKLLDGESDSALFFSSVLMSSI